MPPLSSKIANVAQTARISAQLSCDNGDRTKEEGSCQPQARRAESSAAFGTCSVSCSFVKRVSHKVLRRWLGCWRRIPHLATDLPCFLINPLRKLWAISLFCDVLRLFVAVSVVPQALGRLDHDGV
ncbi:MAG: hypothetical protein ACI8W8_004981 [Rhodothermales bacterium]